MENITILNYTQSAHACNTLNLSDILKYKIVFLHTGTIRYCKTKGKGSNREGGGVWKERGMERERKECH